MRTDNKNARDYWVGGLLTGEDAAIHQYTHITLLACLECHQSVSSYRRAPSMRASTRANTARSGAEEHLDGQEHVREGMQPGVTCPLAFKGTKAGRKAVLIS